MKLELPDLQRLTEFYFYAVNRKFQLEGDLSLEFLLVSDILISLFFKEYNAARSKLAVSVIGSYVGNVLAENLKGSWDTTNLIVKNLGPLRVFASPFSIAYERLSRGLSRALKRAADEAFTKSGSEPPELNHNKVREMLSKLEDGGWFNEALKLMTDENQSSKLRRDFAEIVGIFMSYLDSLVLKNLELVERLLSSPATAPLSLAVLKRVNLEELLPKVTKYLNSNYPPSLKMEAISTIGSYNCRAANELLWEAFLKETEPMLKIYIAQFLKDDKGELAEELIKLWRETADPLTKLAMINAMQSLRDDRFKSILLEELRHGDDFLREEIIKTFQYIPLSEDEVRELLPFLSSPNSTLKLVTAYAIAYSKHPKREELLASALTDSNETVKEHIRKLIELVKVRGEPTFFVG